MKVILAIMFLCIDVYSAYSLYIKYVETKKLSSMRSGHENASMQGTLEAMVVIAVGCIMYFSILLFATFFSAEVILSFLNDITKFEKVCGISMLPFVSSFSPFKTYKELAYQRGVTKDKILEYGSQLLFCLILYIIIFYM